MGGGATSRADGQAIDGTGTSDSYEVTGLPGWLPHRTDRQVAAKTPHPKRAGQARTGSGPCWWGPDIINGKDVLEPLDSQGKPLLGDDGRPLTTADFLDEMRIHPVYGFLFQQRGPTGMQAAGAMTASGIASNGEPLNPQAMSASELYRASFAVNGRAPSRRP